MNKNRRKLTGLVIDPARQFSIVAQLLFVLFGGMFVVGYVGYWSLEEFFQLVIELTGVPSEVREMLRVELASAATVLGGLLFTLASLIAFLLIKHTHKLHGAAFALKRYIDEKLKTGDYNSSLKLRSGDYLQDVAASLNEYAHKMAGNSVEEVKSVSNQD